MTPQELEQYFAAHISSNYERSNYDKYLEENLFSFSFKSIHITGTNGKGSTANFLANIYAKEGYKVGLYVSPYFDSVTEMIRIGNKQIDFETYLNEFFKYKESFEEYNLTTFEMQTIIAFLLFKESNVDLAVIEVGMGGYIDATNIINPILSIITSVSLEHTQYLGRSVSEIASNKAGIIKYQTPVLVGKLDESAMYAIRDKAKVEKATIYVVDDFHNEKINEKSITFDYRPFNNLELKTTAKYQLFNATIAIEATKIVSELLPVKEQSIRDALKEETLYGRFEYLQSNLLIDGAHNPEAINELVKSLENVQKPIHIVFACFRDKNVDLMLNELGVISNDITLTTFDHKRARNEEDYFLYLADYKYDDNYIYVINNLLELYPDDLILVTGSLCFVGMVRGHFRKWN